MLDMDRKSNIVKESLPRNIRSSGTLKVISVIVQHGHRCYLKSDNKGIFPDHVGSLLKPDSTFLAKPLHMFPRSNPPKHDLEENAWECGVPTWNLTYMDNFR